MAMVRARLAHIILQLSGHNQHHEDSDSSDLRLAEYYQAQDRILYSWH